jgi:hypothetical protein
VVHGNKMHYQQLNNDIKTISQKGGGYMNKFKKSLITLTMLSAVVNVNFNYYAAGSAANVD